WVHHKRSPHSGGLACARCGRIVSGRRWAGELLRIAGPGLDGDTPSPHLVDQGRESVMTASTLLVRVLAAGTALACAAFAPPARAQTSCPSQVYQIIHTETSTVGHGLVRSESTVQVGADPLDRFQMVRVVKP